MFRRREKPSFLNRLGTWVWPKGGWRRASHYIMHRLARMPGSSYSIAAGFACGAAVSFTPFVGTHFLWAGCLAWIVRANIIVAFIGTVVGNPWTFPFIWVWLYETGTWMLNSASKGLSHQHPDFYSTFSQMTDAFLRFDLALFLESAIPVVWPMFVSSIPTAFVVWFAFFIPMKKMIDGYQRRHRRRRARKQQTNPDSMGEEDETRTGSGVQK